MKQAKRVENMRYSSINNEFKLWAPKYHAIITGLMKRYFDVHYDDLLVIMRDKVVLEGSETVLEIGVGTGLVAASVAYKLDKGSVHGIDITSEMLEKAKEEASRLGMEDKMKFKLAPAELIPYNDDTFDVIYSSLNFHHFKVTKTFQEMKRVLRPGGRLVILDLGALDVWRTFKGRLYYNLLARMRYLTDPKTRDEFFATYFTKNEWYKIFDKQSFQLQGIEDVSNCTGKVTTESMGKLFKYKSMGTPPLWLIEAVVQK